MTRLRRAWITTKYRVVISAGDAVVRFSKDVAMRILVGQIGLQQRWFGKLKEHIVALPIDEQEVALAVVEEFANRDRQSSGTATAPVKRPPEAARQPHVAAGRRMVN